MSLSRKLRTLACCGILQMGTLLGVPMRPEQVQELMRALGGPAVAHTEPDDAERGDGGDGQESPGGPSAP